MSLPHIEELDKTAQVALGAIALMWITRRVQHLAEESIIGARAAQDLIVRAALSGSAKDGDSQSALDEARKSKAMLESALSIQMELVKHVTLRSSAFCPHDDQADSDLDMIARHIGQITEMEYTGNAISGRNPIGLVSGESVVRKWLEQATTRA